MAPFPKGHKKFGAFFAFAAFHLALYQQHACFVSAFSIMLVSVERRLHIALVAFVTGCCCGRRGAINSGAIGERNPSTLSAHIVSKQGLQLDFRDLDGWRRRSGGEQPF